MRALRKRPRWPALADRARSRHLPVADQGGHAGAATATGVEEQPYRGGLVELTVDRRFTSKQQSPQSVARSRK